MDLQTANTYIGQMVELHEYDKGFHAGGRVVEVKQEVCGACNVEGNGQHRHGYYFLLDWGLVVPITETLIVDITPNRRIGYKIGKV